MPLASGSRLGPYESRAPIGAGGMGEVYHPHDPRLGPEIDRLLDRLHDGACPAETPSRQGGATQ